MIKKGLQHRAQQPSGGGSQSTVGPAFAGPPSDSPPEPGRCRTSARPRLTVCAHGQATPQRVAPKRAAVLQHHFYTASALAVDGPLRRRSGVEQSGRDLCMCPARPRRCGRWDFPAGARQPHAPVYVRGTRRPPAGPSAWEGAAFRPHLPGCCMTD